MPKTIDISTFTPKQQAAFRHAASLAPAGSIQITGGTTTPTTPTYTPTPPTPTGAPIPTVPTTAQPQTYTVKSGDTLSQIAQRLGVRVSDISGYR